MPLTKPHLRLIAWIAAFAVLLGALAPTVSKALARQAAAELAAQSICSAKSRTHPDHAKAVSKAAKNEHGGHGSMRADHCPYCFTHAGSFGLPPGDLPGLLPPGGAGFLPPLHYLAPRSLFAWAAAQPRAPPLHPLA